MVPLADLLAALDSPTPSTTLMLMDHLLALPPPARFYQVRLAKWATEFATLHSLAPSELALSTVLASLDSPPDFEITAHPSLLHRASRAESKTLAIRGDASIGLRVWPAALGLVNYLSVHLGHALAAPRRVLEVGAGTGLAGLYVAQQCPAASVVLTDYNALVLDNLARNARPFGNVSVAKLDWIEDVAPLEDVSDEIDRAEL